jgi:hypothetical protein
MTPAELHRHRILEHTPKVTIIDTRNPAAPWRTVPVRVNAPALTRYATDLDR